MRDFDVDRPPYRYRVYLYILTRSDEVQIDPAILIHLLVSVELRLPFYTGTHLSFAKEWRSRLGDLFQLGAGFTARCILADKTEIYFPTSVQMSCKLPTNCPVPSNHVYDDTFYLISSKLCIASRIERWRAFCAHLGFIWKKNLHLFVVVLMYAGTREVVHCSYEAIKFGNSWWNYYVFHCWMLLWSPSK